MLGNKKIHLALIGKNIQHSLSQSTYEKLLGVEIEYDLIDKEREEDLPTLDDLKKYDGVSITSPYKKHYLSRCLVEEDIKKLGAINCIRFEGKNAFATNTDFLALDQIFDGMKDDLNSNEIFIFGDGPMSLLVQNLLTKRNLTYRIFSRKLKNFSELLEGNQKPSLLINCLSRKVPIPYRFKENDILFDLNYKNLEILTSIPMRITYIDGLELLELQANFALSFWNIKGC